MCRLVAYLGEQVVLDEILFQPDSSIVEQAVHPQLLSAMNLAGFGVVAWDDESPSADLPWTYRTAGLPFFDRNLRALSRKARATATLGHVRGVLLSDREVVNEQNVHPFRYEGIPIALAMNGDLDRFAEMRGDVADLVAPELARTGRGDDRHRMAVCPDPESPGATRMPRQPTPRSSQEQSKRRSAKCAKSASAAAWCASPRSTS